MRRFDQLLHAKYSTSLYPTGIINLIAEPISSLNGSPLSLGLVSSTCRRISLVRHKSSSGESHLRLMDGRWAVEARADFLVGC